MSSFRNYSGGKENFGDEDDHNDDATSEILHARFCKQESTNDYFICLEGYLCKHGKPIELYVDKHSVFRVASNGESKGITVFHQAI